MTANLLSFPAMTQNQSSRVSLWIETCLCQIVEAYMCEGLCEPEAQSALRKITRCGIDELRAEPTATDRAAFAISRCQMAFRGEYNYDDAICFAADMQTIMASQIVAMGKPALQLIRTFAKLEAALQLTADSEN